jgi:hypothetical protein
MSGVTLAAEREKVIKPSHRFEIDLKSVDCGICQVIDEHPTMHSPQPWSP